MLENIRLSFQGIWSHKMRSFLTMLGIIIGIAAIISIVSTIQGTNEQIKQNLIGSGNNTVEICLYQGNSRYQTEYYGMPSGVHPITDETLQEIRDFDHVANVSKYLSRYAYGIFHKSTQLDNTQIYGIDADYFDTCGYIMKRGRGFTEKDMNEYRKVVILDKSTSESLFPDEDPLGQTIEISGEPYVVIGIAEKSSTFKPVINSIEDYYNYVGNEGSLIFMPLTTWPILYGYDEPENVVVRAETTDDMSAVGQGAANILNKTIQTTTAMGTMTPEEDAGDAEGGGDEMADTQITYKAVDLTERAKNLQELSEATNKQLIWIASISLLVGGIGVMNIMLVSVTERTREIGLKKAIGAKNSIIMGQFLTEAAILTSLGGILGVIVGIILAQVISRISSTLMAISVPAIIISVLFSMVIGIVFGLMPSVKASKLNPIDALRHE